MGTLQFDQYSHIAILLNIFSVFGQKFENEFEIWKKLSIFFVELVETIPLMYNKKDLGWKLDVDPQRDDDASPMSTYRCMLRPTWMISALQHKSKYKSNSISNFFEKKNQIFWFPCCSTREDLSVDVSITHVGLILTKLGRFFLGVRKLGVRTEFSFVNFELFEKFSHFWVSMV